MTTSRSRSFNAGSNAACPGTRPSDVPDTAAEGPPLGSTSISVFTRSMRSKLGSPSTSQRWNLQRRSGIEKARTIDPVRFGDGPPEPRVAVGLVGDPIERLSFAQDPDAGTVGAHQAHLSKLHLDSLVGLQCQRHTGAKDLSALIEERVLLPQRRDDTLKTDLL